MTLKFCKWFENTRFKIPRQRDELHLSDNPTGTVLADPIGDNSVDATRVPVIGTTRGHPRPSRVRLSVRGGGQNALFRRMRFSVECAFPHLRKRGVGSRKSAFWQVGSRKSASCTLGLTEKRTLARAPGTRLTKRRTLAVLELAECAFP